MFAVDFVFTLCGTSGISGRAVLFSRRAREHKRAVLACLGKVPRLPFGLN
jgi:hypothetical protein